MPHYELDDNAIISMFDEENNEIKFEVLATKKDEGYLYMLAEEADINEEQEEAEVLIFKCNTESAEKEPDEMVFELLEEGHESFGMALSLFTEDFDNLDIKV